MKDVVFIKELPEQIKIGDKVFSNVPVSGVVVESVDAPGFIEERRHCQGFWGMMHGLDLGGVVIYDPRGFRLRISQTNFSKIMREVNIVRGVIEDEVYYAKADNPLDHTHFFPSFLKSDFPDDYDWCIITKSTKTRKVVDVRYNELVPGNRYCYDDSDYGEFGDECIPYKKDRNIFVYLGHLKAKSLYWKGYRGDEDVFVNLNTSEITTVKTHISQRWCLLEEQSPEDLDLVKVALEKFNKSSFSDNARIEKLDIAHDAPLDTEFDLDKFKEESKRGEHFRCFIKKISDQEIRIRCLYSKNWDKRKLNYYSIEEHKFVVKEKDSGEYILLAGYESSADKGIFKRDELTTVGEGFIRIKLDDRVERCEDLIEMEKFIDCTSNFGVTTNLKDEKDKELKIKL